MKPLAIIPTYLSKPQDLEVLRDCIMSFARTAAGDADLLIVDDGSPRRDLIEALEKSELPLDVDFVLKDENEGFARTVNVGLRRCLVEERDAILVNADLEFIDTGWVNIMVNQERDDRPASIVGALLLYPSGLIQHGGVFFSLLHRCFEHIYKYAPFNLPEAQHARVCPVTGALQFIRLECLQEVGIYDEEFRLGWEDVDYCVRANKSGRACVYQPAVRAYHFESLFRGQGDEKMVTWQQESWRYFCTKWQNESFQEFVPSVM